MADINEILGGGAGADDLRRALQNLERQFESTLRRAEQIAAEQQRVERRAAPPTVRGADLPRIGGTGAVDLSRLQREGLALVRREGLLQRNARAMQEFLRSALLLQRVREPGFVSPILGGPGQPPRLPPGAGQRPALPSGREPIALLPAGRQPAARPITDRPETRRIALPSGLTEEEVRGQIRLQSRIRASNVAIGQQAAVTRTLQGEMARLIALQDAASRSMRRHGALTTEFFQALARGEVTLREVGFQVGSTIGKFAGWTGAAVLVFGALNAIRQLGAGAIESNRGVNQLARVLPNLNVDRAKQSFRDLAREFDLPFEVVTQGAFEMGKVFKDQDEAFQATAVLLQAVKVGELDVADASRFLIAIQQGFKLQAKDLPIVFDQINQAQNQFGVGIRDTAAGVAKAAGAFRLAGGDMKTLIALIGTGAKITGRSGEEIGTVAARISSRLATPETREKLKQFGIDATLPIGEVLNQSFKKSAEFVAAGRKDQAELLARALSTPQLARVTTAILQDEKLFREFLAELAPSKAKGAGARELATTLGALSEQMKGIGVEVTNIGAALEQSGALTFFGGMILLVRESLQAVNLLLDAFTSLPKAVRQSVVVFAQLAAAIALLRRFNLAESFGARPGGFGAALFGRDPAVQRRREVDRQFREQAQFFGVQRETAAGRAAQAGLGALAAQTGVEAAARSKVSRAQAASLAAAKNISIAAAEEAIIAERILAAQVQVTTARQAVAAEEQAALAAQRLEAEAIGARRRFRKTGELPPGFVTVPTTERPTTALPIPVGAAPERERRGVRERIGDLRRRLSREGREAAALRREQALLASAAVATGASAGAAATTVATTTGRLAGLKGLLVGLASKLGTLGFALIGIVTLGPIVKDAVLGVGKRLGEAAANFGPLTSTLDQTRAEFERFAAQSRLFEKLRKEGTPFERLGKLEQRFTAIRSGQRGGAIPEIEARRRALELREQIGRFGGIQAGQAPTAEEATRITDNQKRLLRQIDEFMRTMGQESRAAAEESAAEAEEAKRQAAQLRREQFEARTSLRTLRADIRIGRTGDEGTQIRTRLRTIRRNLIDAIQTFGVRSREVLELIREAQDAIRAVVERQLESIDAQTEFRAAGLGPIAGARERIAGIQRSLAVVQGNARVRDPNEILRLGARLKEEQRALAEAIRAEAERRRERARALVDAVFEERISRTDDPVQIARLELQRAIRLRQFARTREERLRSVADINRRRRELSRTVVGREIENIDLDLEFEKISTAQAITALQNILRTRKLSRDQKIELRRRIKQLRDDTGADDELLRIGDVRLPTIYEIRRAIAGGRRGGDRPVVVNNNVTLRNTINDPGAADAVFQQLDRALTTNTRAAMRSAGVI